MTDIPSLVSLEDVQEYKTIIREECGIELTDQEAFDQALNLTNLATMIADAEMKKAEERPQDDTPSGHQLSLL